MFLRCSRWRVSLARGENRTRISSRIARQIAHKQQAASENKEREKWSEKEGGGVATIDTSSRESRADRCREFIGAVHSSRACNEASLGRPIPAYNGRFRRAIPFEKRARSCPLKTRETRKNAGAACVSRWCQQMNHKYGSTQSTGVGQLSVVCP